MVPRVRRFYGADSSVRCTERLREEVPFGLSTVYDRDAATALCSELVCCGNSRHIYLFIYFKYIIFIIFFPLPFSPLIAPFPQP